MEFYSTSLSSLQNYLAVLYLVVHLAGSDISRETKRTLKHFAFPLFLVWPGLHEHMWMRWTRNGAKLVRSTCFHIIPCHIVTPHLYFGNTLKACTCSSLPHTYVEEMCVVFHFGQIKHIWQDISCIFRGEIGELLTSLTNILYTRKVLLAFGRMKHYSYEKEKTKKKRRETRLLEKNICFASSSSKMGYFSSPRPKWCDL